VRLEVVDIWHFGMSALFKSGSTVEALAQEIASAWVGQEAQDNDAEMDVGRVHAATESLAQDALASKSFSVPLFAELMNACSLSPEQLYRHYVGKNVLNFFRQDHGYQEGTYVKLWQGREDNEHLSELLESLDDTDPEFPGAVYQALSARYPQ